MSFKLFIYYCALCGGWAAFLVWLVVQATGLLRGGDPTRQSTLIAGILGVFLASAVGGMDALLNARGTQRLVRVLVCAGVATAPTKGFSPGSDEAPSARRCRGP